MGHLHEIFGKTQESVECRRHEARGRGEVFISARLTHGRVRKIFSHSILVWPCSFGERQLMSHSYAIFDCFSVMPVVPEVLDTTCFLLLQLWRTATSHDSDEELFSTGHRHLRLQFLDSSHCHGVHSNMFLVVPEMETCRGYRCFFRKDRTVASTCLWISCILDRWLCHEKAQEGAHTIQMSPARFG